MARRFVSVAVNARGVYTAPVVKRGKPLICPRHPFVVPAYLSLQGATRTQSSCCVRRGRLTDTLLIQRKMYKRRRAYRHCCLVEERRPALSIRSLSASRATVRYIDNPPTTPSQRASPLFSMLRHSVTATLLYTAPANATRTQSSSLRCFNLPLTMPL